MPRERRVCGHAGCDRTRSGKGYCSAHYMQWRRTGGTWEIGHREPITARILAGSVPAGDCLTWRGTLMTNGYGQISWGNKKWLVHRAIWVDTHGEIPEGLTVDHLCRNRACVNVAHMDIVTRGENSERGGGLDVAVANYRAWTHCRRGHEYNAANTRLNRKGHRVCRICQRLAHQRWESRRAVTEPPMEAA